jgi:ubiquinone/menaquinone biosynthesis C-methylase UbiE
MSGKAIVRGKKADDYKQESRRSFDAIARSYEHHGAGRQSRSLYPALVGLASSWRPESILDVGCGPGFLLEMLRKPGVRLAGADISARMIGRARERLGSDADLRVADSEGLPWAAGGFDLVLCCLSFHHYPNPEIALSEMSRVLRKKGHLLLADPWVSWPLRPMLNRLFRYGKGGDVKLYSRNEIEGMLGRTGFKNTRAMKRDLHTLIVSASL